MKPLFSSIELVVNDIDNPFMTFVNYSAIE